MFQKRQLPMHLANYRCVCLRPNPNARAVALRKREGTADLLVLAKLVPHCAPFSQVNWKDVLPYPEEYGNLNPMRAGRTLCPDVAALHMFPGITATIIRNFLAPPLKGLVLMGCVEQAFSLPKAPFARQIMWQDKKNGANFKNGLTCDQKPPAGSQSRAMN
jgi:hypothetical protein